MSLPRVSVVIPSCDRGELVLDTVRQLRGLRHPPFEVLVIDQTPSPPAAVAAQLERLEASGGVRWLRRRRRSIPAAMNHGARVARGDVLLFVDDDVRVPGELVLAHARAHARHASECGAACADGGLIVAGQVIQPWQQPLGREEGVTAPGCEADPDAFRFNASVAAPVRRFMAGNVSMGRATLLRLGGFDENFVGAAYRFEADLAQRACAAGVRLLFEPAARVHHLKAGHGGTRSFGHHLRTVAPWHSAGRYYYLLLHPSTPGLLRRTLAEALRALAAREHLRRPWWIPLSALAEIGGLAWATVARLRGPRLPFDPQAAP